MLNKGIVVFALLLALGLGANSFAESVSLDQVISGLRKTHSELRDFQASFTQELHSHGRTERASGTLFMKMPDKMRWDYVAPRAKALITDGVTLWMYLPDDKQVYVQPLERAMNAKIPLQMLTGKLDFAKDYRASLLEDEGGRYRLRFRPRKDGTGFRSVTLSVDKKSYQIVGFELVDLFGTRTVVRLDGIRVDTGLAGVRFRYEDKPGVQVVRIPMP